MIILLDEFVVGNISQQVSQFAGSRSEIQYTAQ